MIISFRFVMLWLIEGGSKVRSIGRWVHLEGKKSCSKEGEEIEL